MHKATTNSIIFVNIMEPSKGWGDSCATIKEDQTNSHSSLSCFKYVASSHESEQENFSLVGLR